jgi:hypothetical protein
MKRPHWAWLAVLAACGTTALGAPAAATTVPTAVQRKTLELVALAKARTELLQKIRALAITHDTTVGDWAAGSVELDRALRLWTRTQPRRGTERVYSDGVCEADVAVWPDALRDELLRLLTELGAGSNVRAVDAAAIQAAARRWPVVWTTGSAALAAHPVLDRPAGWEDVTRAGLDFARQAAEADACHALYEEAGRLKLDAARRLREFFESSDATRAAVQQAICREAKVATEFAPDQVALTTARLGIRELMRVLTRIHDENKSGDEFGAADFREMVLLAGREELTGTGLAPPPDSTLLRNRYALIEYETPAWVGQTLTAVGQFEAETTSAPEPATQYEAARLEAIDQLRRKVEPLVIQQNVTIAEFVGYHQKLKDDLVLFLSGARVVRRQVRPEGGVEVEVELPLRRLWEIVRRGMQVEEVEPAEAGAGLTTSQPAVMAEPAATRPQKENP